MPELPEVERVRIDLAKAWSPNLAVEKIRFFRKDLRYPLPSKKRCSWLLGAAPLRFRRIGKNLLIDFSGYHILSHLGMSGSWRWVTKGDPKRIHDHIRLDLVGDRSLVYHDPRRFGSFEILSSSELEHKLRLKNMGPDPLTEPLDPKMFLEKCRHRETFIKVLLMNQNLIAGIGNIYACEALFRARIHPKTPAKDLSLAQWKKLLDVLNKLLVAAIDMGGTTLRDYVHTSGSKGEFQFSLGVYGRGGKPCPKCQFEITQEVLGQRSTFWCSSCQKEA